MSHQKNTDAVNMKVPGGTLKVPSWIAKLRCRFFQSLLLLFWGKVHGQKAKTPLAIQAETKRATSLLVPPPVLGGLLHAVRRLRAGVNPRRVRPKNDAKGPAHGEGLKGKMMETQERQVSHSLKSRH